MAPSSSCSHHLCAEEHREHVMRKGHWTIFRKKYKLSPVTPITMFPVPQMWINQAVQNEAYCSLTVLCLMFGNPNCNSNPWAKMNGPFSKAWCPKPKCTQTLNTGLTHPTPLLLSKDEVELEPLSLDLQITGEAGPILYTHTSRLSHLSSDFGD
jgi:hypothetical protein